LTPCPKDWNIRIVKDSPFTYLSADHPPGFDADGRLAGDRKLVLLLEFCDGIRSVQIEEPIYTERRLRFQELVEPALEFLDNLAGSSRRQV
jgi:hypothetical protein